MTPKKIAAKNEQTYILKGKNKKPIKKEKKIKTIKNHKHGRLKMNGRKIRMEITKFAAA